MNTGGSFLTGFALAAYTFFAAFFSLILVSRTSYALFGILMIPYPIVAVYLLNWAYALDDLLAGFQLFLLQVVPLLLMFALCFAFVPIASFVKFLAP